MKYKHLYTWDTMMGSKDWYKKDMQELAEREGAPIDAVCKDSDGKWFCASQLDPSHHFWKHHEAIWNR